MGPSQPGIPGSKWPRRPHHSTVVAWLALFIALGGVAAGLPGNNSVGSKDIRSGAVRGPEIHRDAVRSSDLGPEAVGQDDLAAGAIGTAQLLEGAVTPAKIGGVPAARVDTPQQGPGCADQVIESGQTETVQFSFELFDEEDMHADPPVGCAPATQSRLTAPIDGIYSVSAAVSWEPEDAGRRSLEILRTNVGGQQGVATDTREAVDGAGTNQVVDTLINLDVGDYVEIAATNSSPTDLDLGTSIDTYLAMAWIGPPPQ